MTTPPRVGSILCASVPTVIVVPANLPYLGGSPGERISTLPSG